MQILRSARNDSLRRTLSKITSFLRKRESIVFRTNNGPPLSRG
jgi:hypothetical protein